MRSVLLAAVTVLVLGSGAAAQVGGLELSELRKVANISKNEIVRTKANASLSNSKPLKVFLAVKMPGNDKKTLAKMVAEWNREEAARFGHLEIVDDVTKADAVLAQFRYSRSKPAETHSLKIGDRKAVDGTFGSSAAGSGIAVDADRDFDVFHQPVLSYIVVRENDLWSIVYARSEAFEQEKQQSDPGLRMWAKFIEKVRDR